MQRSYVAAGPDRGVAGHLAQLLGPAVMSRYPRPSRADPSQSRQSRSSFDGYK